MQDRRYLLSIGELLALEPSHALWEQCMDFLDTERRQRAERLKSRNKKAESVGAGLLLQLAVAEALQGEQQLKEQLSPRLTTEICRLTFSEIIELLKQFQQSCQFCEFPLLLEYTFGERGKPYLKNFPYYFSLSHSGEYIFLVISDTEVGVDIQQRKPLGNSKIAERFFTEEEKQELATCSTEQERESCFYRLWTQKEAYGKLTGEGIAAVLVGDRGNGRTEREISDFDKSVSREKRVSYEEFHEIENYQITICKWK